MRTFIKTLIIGYISFCSFSNADHMSEKSIDERTRPVGQVNIEGMTKTSEVADHEIAVSIEPVALRTGESIHNNTCIACHSVGLANAPKTGDKDVWTILLERGIDDLVSSAKIGKNVMPPMGNCSDCSDDELKETILFMSGTVN